MNQKKNPKKRQKMNLRKSQNRERNKSPKRNPKKSLRRSRNRNLRKIQKRSQKRNLKKRMTRMTKRRLKRRMTKNPTRKTKSSHLTSLIKNLTFMCYHLQRVKLLTALSRNRPESLFTWSVLNWKVLAKAWVKVSSNTTD